MMCWTMMCLCNGDSDAVAPCKTDDSKLRVVKVSMYLFEDDDVFLFLSAKNHGESEKESSASHM